MARLENMIYELMLEQNATLKRIEYLIARTAPDLPSPTSLPEAVQVGKEQRDDMKWIQMSQPIPALPPGGKIATQHLKIVAGPDTVFDKDVVAGDNALYWAGEGETVTKTFTWADAGGNAAPNAFEMNYVQADATPDPLPSPSDLPQAEQVNETEADVRPTT